MQFIDDEKPDVIFGTETWLKPDIATTEFFPEDYTVYRRDRPQRSGGGVLIGVSKKHISSEVSVSSTQAEQVFCKLYLKKGYMLLGSFYRAPDDHVGLGLRDTLSEIKTQYSQACKIVLAGDFNCPKINWENISEGENTSLPQNPDDKELLNLVHDFGLIQHVTQPTRGHNRLDLVFSNFDDPAVKTEVKPGLGDHSIVNSSVYSKTLKNSDAVRQVLLYKKADWVQIKSVLIDSFESFKLQCPTLSTDENWLYIKSLLLKLMKKHIPQKSYRVFNKYPWVNHNLRHLLKQKRKAHSKAKNTKTARDWDQYCKLHHESSQLDKRLFN